MPYWAACGMSLLGWFALTPLFLAIRGKSQRLAAWYGTLFGILICAGVAHWMYSAISNYFVALFPLDLILAVLSFMIFVGIYTGAISALWSILMRRAEAVGWLGIGLMGSLRVCAVDSSGCTFWERRF